jgi:hypothetical protein
MKKVLFSLITLSLLLFNLSSAKADATYALLDSNGNVLNIIVCGSACEPGGILASPNTVKQVAENPVTGENRGGLWYGPGTTTYDPKTEVFSAVGNINETKTIVEEENGEFVTSSVTISGQGITQFRYIDTVGDNLFTRNNWTYGYTENTSATISVNKNNNTESMGFDNRKTESQIQQSVQDSGLTLLNSKIQVLISLLGSWVK